MTTFLFPQPSRSVTNPLYGLVFFSLFLTRRHPPTSLLLPTFWTISLRHLPLPPLLSLPPLNLLLQRAVALLVHSTCSTLTLQLPRNLPRQLLLLPWALTCLTYPCQLHLHQPAALPRPVPRNCRSLVFLLQLIMRSVAESWKSKLMSLMFSLLVWN